MIPSFKDFLNEKQIVERIMLFEHTIYKQIDKSKNSYRQDTGNTNNVTLTHSHVYAKLNGNGKELYSVNINGSGHDGYSGTEIPKKHADFFRSKGYEIKPNNILEHLLLENINMNNYEIIILAESEEN